MRFEIINRFTGEVVVSGEAESLIRLVEQHCSTLYRANLSGADLSGANLYRATLSGATLYRANLSGADLSRANLYRAKGVNKYRTTPMYMLLDQPGKIRAYKLVKSNGQGPYYGGITYEVDQEYSVDADADEKTQCARGISLASLDWCLNNWQPEYRVLVAEFEATDIAAIPIGTDGKFRVHRCKIVGEKDLKELGLVEEMAEGGNV